MRAKLPRGPSGRKAGASTSLYVRPRAAGATDPLVRYLSSSSSRYLSLSSPKPSMATRCHHHLGGRTDEYRSEANGLGECQGKKDVFFGHRASSPLVVRGHNQGEHFCLPLSRYEMTVLELALRIQAGRPENHLHLLRHEKSAY